MFNYYEVFFMGGLFSLMLISGIAYMAIVIAEKKGWTIVRIHHRNKKRKRNMIKNIKDEEKV